MLIKTESLPTPAQLKTDLPLSPQQSDFIQSSRKDICAVLNGEDPRLLVIVGPCSIHDPIAAKQYAIHLKELAQQTSDTFLFVMRVYFEKARSVLGWKGILYDPNLDGSNDIESGIYTTRKLLVDLAELEIPTAAELLEPLSVPYFSDLLSWGCIGARTVCSQTHRQMASALPMPVGFKNSTDGNMVHAVNGIIAASVSHVCMGVDSNGQLTAQHTSGNPNGHIVLRGSENGPNYDPQSLMKAQSLLREAGLAEQLVIDCSHGNCGRVFEHQRVAFQSSIQQRVEGNNAIRGVVLESYLSEGNQNINSEKLQHGVSITDPCLGWSMTEQLIYWGHTKLNTSETQQDPIDTLCMVD